MPSRFSSSPHILPCALAILLPLSLLIWIAQYILPFRNSNSQLSPVRCFMSILVPTLILYDAAKGEKLDGKAMVAAFLLGFVETLSNLSMMVTTIVFFLLGTKATKIGKERKLEMENKHKSGGRRNWIQVISNGGIGMELAILMLIEKGPANEMPINFPYDYFPSWLSIAFLGAMACACGDTLASELATVLSSSMPRLITNPFKKVPKGTNGGITFEGLIWSAIGGLACGLSYYACTILTVNRETLVTSPPQWPLLIVGVFGGLLGSIIDSILGATLQYSGLDKLSGKIVERPSARVTRISGREILDNHSVNLMATLLTALIMPNFGRLIWANI